MGYWTTCRAEVSKSRPLGEINGWPASPRGSAVIRLRPRGAHPAEHPPHRSMAAPRPAPEPRGEEPPPIGASESIRGAGRVELCGHSAGKWLGKWDACGRQRIEVDMPAAMVDNELIKDAVRSACRAPSLHNSQPWQWVARRGQLELFLGLGRAMVSDRSGREALIGCGAALDHLRVATAAAGWQVQVSRLPDPNAPNHLASITLTPIECVTDSQRSRASAIWARRTDRLPFIAPMNWEALEQSLRSAIDNDAVHLDVMPDDVRHMLAQARGSPNRCGSMTPPTIMNFTGGQHHSRRQRAFRTVPWCRRPKATVSTSGGHSR
jgi:hypothetical protein